MFKLILLTVFSAALSVGAADTQKTKTAKVATEQSPADTFSLQLLNAAKTARTKLQGKQDAAIELQTISNAKKNIETMRLKAASEFAKQQAALDARKADKVALEAFETQRKGMNTRFNELARLIDQVGKNQKTALLAEKLNELIIFLEPAASATVQKEAVKTPPKKLSRGAAPIKQEIPAPKSNKK